jgi:hypothetical protein
VAFWECAYDVCNDIPRTNSIANGASRLPYCTESDFKSPLSPQFEEKFIQHAKKLHPRQTK